METCRKKPFLKELKKRNQVKRNMYMGTMELNKLWVKEPCNEPWTMNHVKNNLYKGTMGK